MGSNLGVDTICRLSSLLVVSLALRGFSLGTSVFPSPQKPTLPNSNPIWNTWTRFNDQSAHELISAPWVNNYKIYGAALNFVVSNLKCTMVGRIFLIRIIVNQCYACNIVY